MLITVVCKNCGFPLSKREELFLKLREEKYKKMIKEDPSIKEVKIKNIDVSDILKKLGITLECCVPSFIANIKYYDAKKNLNMLN